MYCSVIGRKGTNRIFGLAYQRRSLYMSWLVHMTVYKKVTTKYATNIGCKVQRHCSPDVPPLDVTVSCVFNRCVSVSKNFFSRSKRRRFVRSPSNSAMDSCTRSISVV